MRSVDGSLNCTESLPGRCCWYSPELVSVLSVSGLTIVWSNVARAVFTFAHAATARSSRSLLPCAARGAEAAALANTPANASARNRCPVIVLRVRESGDSSPVILLPSCRRSGPGRGCDGTTNGRCDGACLAHELRELVG